MDNGFFMIARCDGAAYNEFGETLTRGAAPRYVHLSRKSAEREAERLSLLHPDREYAILECVSMVRAEQYEIAGRKWNVPIYQAPH